MPGMTWDADAMSKFFLIVLRTSDVKIDFKAVADELTTDETTCTPRAVQEQLKKLKKKAMDGISESKETSPKPNTRKRKSESVETDNGNGTADDDDVPAPKKKKAATGAKKAAKGKGKSKKPKVEKVESDDEAE